MKTFLKLFARGPSTSVQKYEALVKTIAEANSGLDVMRQAFTEGGTITEEELRTYEISTPDNLIPYPTGKYVIAYRLPDIGGCLRFHCVCVAPEGKKGEFEWHRHPRLRETVKQITLNGYSDGKKKPPMAVTVFGAGDWHNYLLDPNASIDVIFERIP